MKRKVALAAAAFCLSGFGLADKTASNLIGITAADLCGAPVGYVVIDGVENTTLSSKITQIFKDQDLLFASNFATAGSKCRVLAGMNVNVMSVKNNSGVEIGYAYSYVFHVFPTSGIVKLDNREIKVSMPVIYDIRSMGVVGSREALNKVIEDNAEEKFKDFLLDWRRTH